MEKKTYNEEAHRLMEEARRSVLEAAEAVCGPRESEFDLLTEMDVATRKLHGLLDLLGTCRESRADEVTWEGVAEAMQTFTWKLMEIHEDLFEHWKAGKEKGNGEASPTAAKQTEEAPKGQDS